MPSPLDRLIADADRLAESRRVVPSSTYRMQMHAGFNLADARAITTYLHSLGVSHAYTSSMLAAKPGSTHGYDVIDHGRLNPEIGTEEELEAWVGELRAAGMGWILDTVPNHMSVGGPNEWWADVLEHGPASPYAGYFDIAWNDHPREQLHGRVLLPILGQPYGAEIEAGRFRVLFTDGAFTVDYSGMKLPVDPRTYGSILSPALDGVREQLGAENEDVIELQSILTSVKNLPTRADGERAAEGWSESRVINRRLAELTGRNAAVLDAIHAALSVLNGIVGDPASFVKLEELLEAQAYRPSFWRVASDEINYRRFFDVNDLAALTTEREEVLLATHRKVYEWVLAARLDGLRIDHPDGLYNPKEYLDRLQVGTRMACARSLLDGRPEDYPDLQWVAIEAGLRQHFAEHPKRVLYVTVEKILTGSEQLREEWATDGTTGYEFINQLNGLFVDPVAEPAMSRLYRDLAGFEERFDQLVYSSKFHILQSSLASELHMLAHQLDRLAQAARWSRDFTLNGLRHALREVIACFPVYRSYVNGGITDQDRQVILRAVARARRKNPLLGGQVFNFIRDTLLLKDPPSGPASPEYRAGQRHFAGKFQQLTSPTMAKGFEDTVLYVYSRLISLNEVGGEPDKFGRPAAEIHHVFAERQARLPGSLSPLSTHDTKRSEDVRARINVLSEVPDEWGERVRKWMELNLKHKVDLGEGQLVLDANEEYFLYQTLLGVWPLEGVNDGNRAGFLERVQQYLNKALHEAKVHTTWINPNTEYDAAAAQFLGMLLDPAASGEFLADFDRFHQRISRLGLWNSLAQTLVRAVAPGVPDTYQGTELWDFSLVDPDNRRPVDYKLRARMLEDLDERASRDPLGLSRELLEHPEDGRIKLFVLSRALRLRQIHAGLFRLGDYVAVQERGDCAGHVFCFARRLGNESVLAVVPRLVANLPSPPTGESAWGDSRLVVPTELGLRWKNHLTGETVRADPDGTLSLASVLANFPLALLEASAA